MSGEASGQAHVLVVEDDRAVRESLRRSLEFNGYRVSTASDGAEALAGISGTNPDAIVMDVMMPRLDGLETTRALRKVGNRVPILVLTARDAVGDRVEGLDAGADDYLTKPFALEELLSRLRALLRRATPPEPGEVDELLSFADLTMDLAAHRVRRRGRDIHLGPTEFRLLRYLMEHQGRVFSREQLLDMVWGQDVYVEPRTVDVHIRRLRKAINAPSETDLIRTVRSAGYSLDREA